MAKSGVQLETSTQLSSNDMLEELAVLQKKLLDSKISRHTAKGASSVLTCRRMVARLLTKLHR